MRDFRLGVIGGCLSHQPGVPPSQLYHRRLARQLQQKGVARLRVRIARDFEKPHVARLEQLLHTARLDAVLVHVRSEFTRKASLITIQVRSDGIHYYWHPFLLRQRRHGWAELEGRQFSGCRQIHHRRRPAGSAQPAQPSSQSSTDPEGAAAGATRLAGVSIRDAFYAAGRAVGLHRWAIADELVMLRDLARRCAALNLPLLVLGPSRRPANGWLDQLCRRCDRELQAELAHWPLAYCSLPELKNQAGACLYGPDGLHLTAEGHGYVASRLLEPIQRLISCTAPPLCPQGTSPS
jgi:hypothetical protein